LQNPQSVLYLNKGDLHKAIPVLERGLGLCQVWNISVWFPATAADLGYAYTLSGRVAEALPLLEQAVDRAVSMKLLYSHALWIAWLSEAYWRAGRLEEALKFARRTLDLSRDRQERGSLGWALCLLGEITAQHDPLEVELAEDHYRQALALAEELGMRPLQAHCHLGLGTLYVKIGRRQQADTELSTAIELYRAMDMTFWLPQAEAALAQVEGR
jgi:tetratricopeptide (TPR) repeat protein